MPDLDFHGTEFQDVLIKVTHQQQHRIKLYLWLNAVSQSYPGISTCSPDQACLMYQARVGIHRLPATFSCHLFLSHCPSTPSGN